VISYLGPTQDVTPGHGLAICDAHFYHGDLQAVAMFPNSPDPPNLFDATAGLVFGYEARTNAYYMVQLAAHGRAYSISQSVPAFGWVAVKSVGSAENLQAGKRYRMRVSVSGQRVSFSVDGVVVIDSLLPQPLQGDGVGLYAYSNTPVVWTNLTLSPQRPTIFVIMQFGAPYDQLYSEVIKAVAAEMKCDIVRVDEQLGPGLIIADIQRLIQEARVVIADVTPHNPNVFYELGYAHALGKPTILLASDVKQLPFDIRGYRVVVYEDSIAGKRKIEKALKEHLLEALNVPSRSELIAAAT
jgi:hypothetical protein